MVLNAIENLLNRYIGLDTSTIGPAAVRQAVRTRMAAGAFKNEQDYLHLLPRSRQELNLLVEEIVVAETWFFRDQEPFRYLAKHVRDMVPDKAPLRVLCVACSTGEEPYSIAMTLLDGGLSPQRFHLDAVDISVCALAKAARAVYTRNSFRGSDAGYRERYFQKTPEGYRLSENVRQCVTFYHANAAETGFLSAKPPYHIIFCRNLMIYLDLPTRAGLIRSLERALTPGGLLFVGHAETSAVPHARFLPIADLHTFAFKKNPNPSPELKSEPVRKKPVPQHPDKPKFSAAAAPAAAALPAGQDAKAPVPHQQARPPEGVSLRTAAQLADRGDLVAAAALCQQAMEREGPSAEGYNLLGIIREAEGKLKEAEDCFNKAVYLNHDHAEALTHLSLLLERQGQSARAAHVRRHAARAESAGGVH